jgi:Peptidase family M23
VALVLTVVGVALAVSPPRTALAAASPGPFGYPVKPFHREHPVRAYLGDPRTVFHAPPTLDGLMTGAGSFSFHQGVDISAPDGTAVYPVESGVVTDAAGDWVGVDSGNGRSFEYWHIRPLVKRGQHVEVDQTILGRIVRTAGHVHLTEYEHGAVANPLAPGQLSPFTDTTAPRVQSISVRGADPESALLPGFLRGRITILAETYDRPTMPVPGVWKGLPTAPALITWRIQRPDGKVIVPDRTAVDFRSTVPENSAFWTVYARGTYQNMCVFGPHYSYMEGGEYLFRLTPDGLDTSELADGVYDLVVTATDMRGNHGSLTLRITVHNRPGWIL